MSGASGAPKTDRLTLGLKHEIEPDYFIKDIPKLSGSDDDLIYHPLM